MSAAEQDLVHMLAGSSVVTVPLAGLRWTSLQLNKGRSNWHVDSGNEGWSAIIALGNFTGGKLLQRTRTIDVHNKIFLLDGSLEHATEEFDGERFSMVFFRHEEINGLPGMLKAKLDLMGFPWREPDIHSKAIPEAIIIRTEQYDAMPNTEINFLYLFAGIHRKCSVGWELITLGKTRGFTVLVTEVDILQEDGDLADDEVWDSLHARIKRGEFDCSMISPPCDEFARAKYSKNPGPKPIRSKRHPLGFPWLKGKDAKKLATTNLLIERSLLTLRSGYASSAKTLYVLEFPEDLGAHTKGVPANLWQLDEARTAVEETHGESCAHFTCQWMVESLKPARTASNVPGHSGIGYVGWPAHDAHDKYEGPLPRTCPHGGHEPIQGKDDQGNYYTRAFGAYAPRMNRYLAVGFFNAVVTRRIAILTEMGEAGEPTFEANTSNDELRGTSLRGGLPSGVDSRKASGSTD